ncbi:protein of unknown function [Methylorubrum extorquens]|uniref:Uncharacterized protein n=1 Tax=Methylorubrum extorquens TaxID=408 RepID=A0A2N9AQ62_METEX|nr:protein of unknown function [Methylorubrum extorquens]
MPEARPYRVGLRVQAWPQDGKFNETFPEPILTPSARLSAAIEILDDIAERRRPAADALKDWGLAHRYAGSGDRAAIASLVYDGLRRRASAAWVMGAETGRAIVIGMLRLQRGLAEPSIASLFDGARFAPPTLTEDERKRLAEGKPRRRAARGRGRYAGLRAAVADRAARRCAAARIAGARPPGAARYPRQHPETEPRRGVRGFGRPLARDDAALGTRPAHPARRGWARPGAPCRSAVSGGRVRDSGRGLADREPARRGETGRDRGRSLRGRGRQVAGARRDHRQRRPHHCHRCRSAPARPDPRAPAPLGCAGRGAHAAHRQGARRRAGRSRRHGRPGSGRCALHRHRHVAPQPGCQVAPAAGQPRWPARRAGRGARPGGPSAAPRWNPRLRHLLAPARGERRRRRRIAPAQRGDPARGDRSRARARSRREGP